MIELVNFKKQYSDKALYTNTNSIFPDNSISFLMGSNGCGKTTLLKCIAGLEHYEGEIKFDSKPLNEVRKDCFVIWDDTPFFNNLNGIRNLFIMSESKKTKKEIVSIAEKYIDTKTLHRKVKTYSYGQKKKLALALADILSPEFLIMDEISNGLDIDMMNDLAKHLIALKNNTTILLTGHQFSFYEKIAEHIFLKKNDTIYYISPEERSNRSLEEIYHG